MDNRVEMRLRHTELEVGVLSPDLVTRSIGEEHVCGETTLGGIGV